MLCVSLLALVAFGHSSNAQTGPNGGTIVSEETTVQSIGGGLEVHTTTTVEEVTESVTFCNYKIAGVVSTEPAHLMNSDIDGVAIALKGRVPCKVEGPVKKGDILVTGTAPGTATGLKKDSAMPSSLCVVGKSLEDSDDAGIKMVEIAV